MRSEFRSANRQAVNVRESDSKSAEQAPALQRRLLVPVVSLAEPTAVPSSSAVAEPPVPGHSDCQVAAEWLVVEQVVAGTGKAERRAAEATVVVPVAAPFASALALDDRSAGIAADGLPLVVEDSLAVPVDIVAAAGTPAEVHTVVVSVADAAAGTERPVGSDSCKEPVAVGTVERVDAMVVAERPGSASGSAE